MALEIDHLVWACPDLASGVAKIKELFNVAPAIGGAHPAIGTRNALLSLGPEIYLEIIAPDVGKLRPDSPGDRLRGLSEPGLMTWVSRSSRLEDLAALVHEADAAFVPIGPIKTQRETVSLEILNWELLFVTQHKFGGLMPFFIDWKEAEHPSVSAPLGGKFRNLRLCSPDAPDLNLALQSLKSEMTVEHCHNAAIELEVAAPSGKVTLSSTPETLQLSLI